MSNYGVNDIETLSFKDGVRQRIAMYLGSADNQGVENGIQEIISNSIDEYYMGYGDKICVTLYKDKVCVRDFGRGIPFGEKDGENVLENIFSKAHTGGKFNEKVYQSVAGLNGIGAKATCLSSKFFRCISMRDGRYAEILFEKGDMVSYEEGDLPNNEKNLREDETGTYVEFYPDEEAFNLEPIKIEFSDLCRKCKNLSYLTKGLTFLMRDEVNNKTETYCAQNGILDLISDKVKSPVHNNPIYYELKDGNMQIEIALQWTKEHENFYCFTNGLMHSEGGTSLTGIRTSITRNINKIFNKNFSGEMARTGLVYAVSCKIPNPSFANQTKTKINNPELRSLADRAFSEAIKQFENQYPNDMKQIKDFLSKEEKAEAAAARARTAVMESQKSVEKELKKKSVLAGKLVDCEKHNEESQLLIVEGKSALGSIVNARDGVYTACFPLRGKIINVLKNTEEDIFNNQEVKELQIALGCGIGDKFNMKKLRYGRVCIAADMDMDGYSIVCLVLTFFYKYYPELIRQGKVYWARTPLFSVVSGGKTFYAYSEEELAKLPKGKVSRNKGLGELSAIEMKATLFSCEDSYVQFTMEDAAAAAYYFNLLLGENVKGRREYIFENIDFEAVEE